MSGARTIAVALLALVATAVMHRATAQPRSANQAGPHLTDELRAAGLRFAPGVAPADQQLVLREIASARPEARRLIGAVDGLTTVSVGPATAGGGNAVGLTQFNGTAFDVTLDLARVYATEGERGVQRLVLHELGHVVDGALVPQDLAGRLDALIPRGYSCDPGQPTSACAPRPERFAETFAKWATGDIGFNSLLGYKVQPPGSLESWGAVLMHGPFAADKI